MLGRLARWLRVLGYDTSYDMGLADPEFVRRAEAEDRILLTRDRHLLQDLRPVRAHEVRRDEPLLQLKDLVEALQLAPPAQLFTRCLLDNAALEHLDAQQALPLLPEGVRVLAHDVRRCPRCGRLYWDGSHVRRMRAALERALRDWPLPAD